MPRAKRPLSAVDGNITEPARKVHRPDIVLRSTAMTDQENLLNATKALQMAVANVKSNVQATVPDIATSDDEEAGWQTGSDDEEDDVSLSMGSENESPSSQEDESESDAEDDDHDDDAAFMSSNPTSDGNADVRSMDHSSNID